MTYQLGSQLGLSVLRDKLEILGLGCSVTTLARNIFFPTGSRANNRSKSAKDFGRFKIGSAQGSAQPNGNFCTGTAQGIKYFLSPTSIIPFSLKWSEHTFSYIIVELGLRPIRVSHSARRRLSLGKLKINVC